MYLRDIAHQIDEIHSFLVHGVSHCESNGDSLCVSNSVVVNAPLFRNSCMVASSTPQPPHQRPPYVHPTQVATRSQLDCRENAAKFELQSSFGSTARKPPEVSRSATQNAYPKSAPAVASASTIVSGLSSHLARCERVRKLHAEKLSREQKVFFSQPRARSGYTLAQPFELSHSNTRIQARNRVARKRLVQEREVLCPFRPQTNESVQQALLNSVRDSLILSEPSNAQLLDYSPSAPSKKEANQQKFERVRLLAWTGRERGLLAIDDSD